MVQKNRNTKTEQEEKTVSAEEAQEQALLAEVEELPTPAKKGPLPLPDAPVKWWLYVAVAASLTIVALVVGVIVLLRPVPESVPEPAPGPVQDLVPDVPLEGLSFLSVVDPVQQSRFFTGDTDECNGDQIVDITPLPNAPHVTRPAVTEEHVYFAPVMVMGMESYETNQAFLEELDTVNQVVQASARNGIKLTLHLGRPFHDGLVNNQRGGEVVGWANAGHEIGFYFDEAVDLGIESLADAEEAPYGFWLSAMHDMQSYVGALCDCDPVSWSGGGSFEKILDVGAELELSAMSNWQTVEESLPEDFLVTTPWTPLSSGTSDGMRMFHPVGSVVYVPPGIFPGHCPQIGELYAPVTDRSVTFMTQALYATESAAFDEKVNVFSFAMTPDMFVSENAVGSYENWLRSVVGRELRTGRIRATTLGGIAEAYFEWLEDVEGTIVPVYLETEEDGEMSEELE